MEKRVFLAIFLSFVVLAIYQTIVPSTPPAKPASAQVVVPTASDASPTSAATPTPSVDPAQAAQAAQQTAGALPVVADASARDIIVETDTVRAVFSSAGGTLRSWKLKKVSRGHRAT